MQFLIYSCADIISLDDDDEDDDDQDDDDQDNDDCVDADWIQSGKQD